jgi:hypothetical protein
MPRLQNLSRAVVLVVVLAGAGSAAEVQAQTPVPEAPPPAGATDQAPAIVPSAPPGIYVTPSTRPMFRPPVQRDQEPPVEGCPAGDNRKLELLV